MQNPSTSPRRLAPTVIAIGVAQILGWGVTFNLPGVIGTSIADSFDSSLDMVLVGPTIMLSILAVVSWFISPLFEKIGARILMIAGAVVIIAGLVVMSIAPNLAVFLAAWILFGFGGAASLSTAAQIALAEVFGDRARQAISAMSLVSGLSNTILWPVISKIDGAHGWRTVIVIGICSIVLVYIPLVATFGAKRSRKPPEENPTKASEQQRLDPMRFVLVAGVTALNGFITWGFSLTLIPLLIQKGVDPGRAVTLASLLGLFSIAARLFDAVGGRSPLQSAMAATSAMLGAFVLLYVGSSWFVAAAFVLVYGLSSGLLSVARATLPLAIFPPQAYARAASRLALPMNLAFAAAPPTFARILEHQSANAALLLSLVLSALALAALAILTSLVKRQTA